MGRQSLHANEVARRDFIESKSLASSEIEDVLVRVVQYNICWINLIRVHSYPAEISTRFYALVLCVLACPLATTSNAIGGPHVKLRTTQSLTIEVLYIPTYHPIE
mmetsp:Transcript_62829/g.99671  ORF Transcript_62829/g.99671 Transcript_62829/m.99671 type:complete len:105 (+) Transcript_62829:110-424(+)